MSKLTPEDRAVVERIVGSIRLDKNESKAVRALLSALEEAEGRVTLAKRLMDSNVTTLVKRVEEQSARAEKAESESAALRAERDEARRLLASFKDRDERPFAVLCKVCGKPRPVQLGTDGQWYDGDPCHSEDDHAELAALRARLAEVEALKRPLMQCGRHGHATCPECWDGMAEENKTLRAEVERMRRQIEADAKSLEWIASDRETIEPGSEMNHVWELRAYAANRAKVARAALSGGEGESHGG